jgi:phosphohistidine phosphatase SixA
MARYVLLARHGEWEHSPFLPDAVQFLTQAGKVQGREIAKEFAEHIALLPKDERIRVGQIWHSPARYARESAELFKEALDLVQPEKAPPPSPELLEKDSLKPGGFWTLGKPERLPHVKNVSQAIRDALTDEQNALLVVGHQPMLGAIAAQFNKHGKEVPLARSELVCIRVDDQRLMWTIEPSNPRVEEQLRAKIAAKIDVAKVLGALITAVLALSIGQLVDPNKANLLKADPVLVGATVAATLLFLLAEVLYLRSIYAYDSLLMPVRFWAEGAKSEEVDWLPRRPPSSTTYVLYVNMVRIWEKLFTPATYALVGGLAFFGYAIFRVLLGPGIGELVALGAIVAIGDVTWYLNTLGKPRLGTQD